ncbi:hypothetical protein ABL78_0577 [Leptomonas seymouri]|uniref:Uncharacterized protein n=1 Tax=Leptomonas seymouri TaxID=5684 RepID=A0A0N1I8P2_LEPSE|nr:hypothetical protein ABL78_0577 [Leptomonas seymouri]|eukprot:KPI90350.1 hypothetical protein ABL78_0577 [Leptomonas seymouri]
MSLPVERDLVAHDRRIVNTEAPTKPVKPALDERLSNAPSLSFSPSSSNASSPVTSAATSSEPVVPPQRVSWTWMHVQQRMRMLHAWDAKCTVEEQAVRQLEREAQQDMDDSMSRKSALMEQLQRLCREEMLLNSSESLLQSEIAALASGREKLAESCRAAEKQRRITVDNNAQRHQQLEEAQQDFERRKALHEEERQEVREETAELDARTADLEAKIVATVQRIADQERKVRFLEADILEAEQTRIEALQREVSCLLSHLEAQDR